MKDDDSRPGGFVFYPRDFSADSRVELMTTEEVGAYTLLLCKAWHEAPAGSLPNNDRALAIWTRMTPERFLTCKASIMSPFELRDDGRWHQKRMQTEYQRCMEIRAKRSDAANKRWQPSNVTHMKSTRYAKAMQMHNTSNADSMQEQCTQTKPNQTKPNKETEASAKADLHDCDLLGSSKKKAGCLDEVTQFMATDPTCQEHRLNGKDARFFWNKMEGCGWKNNGRLVRDWHCTIRTWADIGTVFPTSKQPHINPAEQTERKLETMRKRSAI